jgi:MFS family permease
VSTQISGPTYRQLLARPHIASVLAAVTVGRLAAGLVPFGMISIFTDRRELFWAGASFAAFLIGAAVGGPYKGRLVDRHGAIKLVMPMAFGFTVAAGLGGLAATFGHALVALILIAASAVLAPPTSAILRSVWTAVAVTETEIRGSILLTPSSKSRPS